MESWSWVITSFSGAFAFGFIGKFTWGKIMDGFGPTPAGGLICAGFLVGTFWILNHFVGMIKQTDSNVWVDQGFAIGCAFLFADIANKAFNKNSFWGILTALAGGSLAGMVLALL